MNAKSLVPSKRKLTFLIIIISLIAIFFCGYYFYYIPGNKAILHKNGFVILEDIQKNIKDRNGDMQKLFSSFLKNKRVPELTGTIKGLQLILDSSKIGGTVFLDSSIKTIDKNMGGVLLTKIAGDTFIYQTNNLRADQAQVLVPAKNFMEPILAYQKKELFSAYLLISKDAGLIYIDPELAMVPGIIPDSLIYSNRESLFAGIKDIKVEDVGYKMFYYPFKLGNEQIYLCGFLKTESYLNDLSKVPVTFIYPIVIALLLIIMLLPIIKFYVIGKDEHIIYVDFVLGVLSFFVGTAMFTLIIIQVLLLLSGDIRARENLGLLSTKIDRSFKNELSSAYHQLNKIDSTLHSLQIANSGIKNDSLTTSTLLKEYFSVHAKEANLYFNFDRIAWVNSSGKQLFKAQIDTAKPVLTNVAERNYFKIFKTRGGYALPNEPGARFGFEPINSWTNGEFSIIISKKSLLDSIYIATISTQMYSVTQSILPPGFGFCIIDNDGNILLHSEMNRNLQENFFTKTEPSRQIKEGVASRQHSFFSSIQMNGKTNAINIDPIVNTPLHLVTFYDKGYIVPVNMRIFSFSAIFCIISFFICLLLWLGVFRKKYPANKVLYTRLRNLQWVIPQKKDVKFYTISSVFLLVFLLLSLPVIFVLGNYLISNYTILILVLLLPVNIFSGLFVINFRVKKDIVSDTDNTINISPQKALKAVVVQVLASTLAYYMSYNADYPLSYGFWVYQLFFTILLIAFFLMPKKILQSLYLFQENYLSLYCVFVTILIVCLSVLPASVYTWYAHNQEIVQSVKKEQLYLANAIQQRAGQQAIYYKNRYQLNPSPDYFRKLELSYGIYNIYNDSILIDSKTPPSKYDAQGSGYEKFYFSIAKDIGNNYYDPLLMPALKDNSTDSAWYWYKEKDTMSFWYPIYAHPFSDSKLLGTNNGPLKIVSIFPHRYTFVVASAKGILLFLIIFIFIYGLFLLLRYVSERLFLKKFIDDTENNSLPSNRAFVLFTAYKEFKERMGQAVVLINESDIKTLQKDYEIFKPVQDSLKMYQQEKIMITALKNFSGFYDFIWDICTPNEKYLLLNHAKNGFVNFKNTEVITHLIQVGIFVIRFEEMQLFSASFRAYILSKKHSAETKELLKEFQQSSTWQTFRMPLLIILLTVALFIFFTQEQTFQKIMAMVAGISSIASLILKFFTDGGNLFSSKK